MRFEKLRCVLLAVTLVGFATSALAVEGRKITYQGQITGVPVEDVLAVQARIYSSPTAVTEEALLWGDERHEMQPDADGSFVIVLGATELDERGPDGSGPDGIPDLDQVDANAWPLYLELELELSGGELALLRPRQRIYPAFHATTVARVERSAIPALAINESRLDDDAVTSAKIADLTIDTADLAPESVGHAKLKPNAVITEKIEDNAVTSEKILDLTIRTEDLADASVGGMKIKSDAISGAKIADGTLGSADLAGGSVTNAKLGFQLSHYTATASPGVPAQTPMGEAGQYSFCALTYTGFTAGVFGSATHHYCRVSVDAFRRWILYANPGQSLGCVCQATCF